MTDTLPPLPEPVATIGTDGHPRHARHVWGVLETRHYGPPVPLFTAAQLHAYAAAAVAAERERAFTAGFDAGWRTAADWAGRDDLLSDMDSSAYAADQARALREQMKGASHD